MNRTIAAIASGQTPAAIGVIRISGDASLAVVQKCLRNKKLTPRMMHHRTLFDIAGEPVDDVLLCYFKAPHSYTGEDGVEIYAHGGAVNLGRVLNAVCEAGAVPAGPGEFSHRAFLNGKIDLSRAEAIMDIIHARNGQQCREAQKQLSGSVSAAVGEMRETVMKLLCAIEATIDFSTEEELAPMPVEKLRHDGALVLDQIMRMKRAHDQYRAGGLRVVLVGCPNAGKSSLFNKLAGYDRAIVTDIAGTTTDTIETQVTIQHEFFCLIDTAGITETDNAIEKIGVERARNQIRTADILLVLSDGAADDEKILVELGTALGKKAETAAERMIFLHTKADLEARPDLPAGLAEFIKNNGCPCLSISTVSRAGLAKLESRLVLTARRFRESTEDVALVTSQRHIACLDEAAAAVRRSLDALETGLPAECIAEDLHEAAQALADITGAFAAEDIVNEIFSHFCVGK